MVEVRAWLGGAPRRKSPSPARSSRKKRRSPSSPSSSSSRSRSASASRERGRQDSDRERARRARRVGRFGSGATRDAKAAPKVLLTLPLDHVYGLKNMGDTWVQRN